MKFKFEMDADVTTGYDKVNTPDYKREAFQYTAVVEANNIQIAEQLAYREMENAARVKGWAECHIWKVFGNAV